MLSKRILNRNTLLAAAALAGTSALVIPPVYRASVTALIDHTLESRFAASADCKVDPEFENTGWFEMNPDRLCTVNAAEMPVGGTPENPFMAAAFVGGEWGATVTVLGTDQSPSILIHERAHREQKEPPLQTTADRVVWRTFRESDARLAVIIQAYRDLLSTGDRTLWRDTNIRHPEMLRVFDALLIEDEASRESLANGGLPSVQIMRRTAMAYLFSRNAVGYLQDGYAYDYPNMAAVLASDSITLTPAVLASHLPREGVVYLYTEGKERQNSPLNRWVLYETLGVGLPQQERPSVEDYITQEAELRRAIEAASTAEVATLTAQRAEVCRRSPEALAYRAAGLERFRGQLEFTSMAEPLRGIALPPELPQPVVEASTYVAPPARARPPSPPPAPVHPRRPC